MLTETVIMKLTKAVVDEAEPRAARFIIWDEELPGLGLRVEPSGLKTFVARYRAEGGGRNAPQRQTTIGKFGTLTVAQARAAAVKVLAAAELGQDPVGDLAAKRRAMTLSALIDVYEAEGCVIQRGVKQGVPMKPLTKAYTLARLRHHVVPLLGNRRASEIVEGDIERFVRDVARGKTARDEVVDGKRVIVRGGEGAARKVVRDLSAVFSFAQRRRIVSGNPVAMASVRKTDNARDRFLTLEEVKSLGTALDDLEASGTNSKALNITRLWALTGCRRNEIAGLRWDWVDLGRGLLDFHDTKTGRSIRPLGAAAIALLESLKENAAEDAVFVFPAERGDGHFQGTKKIWPEVVKRAKLPGVTPHTLRHTLGSSAASGGEALLLVGAILGHSNARSTQIYAHIDRDPARMAADRAISGIAKALGRTAPAAADRGEVADAA